jgi:hypothetical protein
MIKEVVASQLANGAKKQKISNDKMAALLNPPRPPPLS